MKRLLLIFLFLPLTLFAQGSPDGGKPPLQGNQIGGIGPDGQFHFWHINNDGTLSITTGLPTGASTAANQTNVEANAGSDGSQALSVQGITGGKAVPVSGTFWQATQPVSGTFWQATQPVSGTFWQATQPISAASLPLPAGAATSANQPTLVSGRVPVDPSGVTSPISAVSLPLPALASTSTKQSDGTQKTQIVNAAGTEIYTGTLVNSTAYEASHVLKASAGQLVSLAGYNSKTSAQFIQVFNSTTVPADTTAPILTFTVPASSNFSYDVPITGLPLGTGIAVSNSSTGPTKTIGSADCYFTAVIR